MTVTDEERSIDRKGRITIPKEIRDRLGLSPGDRVRLDVEEGRLVVSPKVSRETFVATMAGCIDESTRREDAKPVDPLDSASMWTSDLPE